MKRLIFTALISMLAPTITNAQVMLQGPKANDICKGCTRITYGANSGAPGFIDYGQRGTISDQNALPVLREVLNAGPNDDLQPYRSETDKLGFTHQRFQQYYHNIKVEGGEYLVHSKNGVVQSMNGLWIDKINVPLTAGISESKALSLALKHTNASKYKWEIAGEEKLLKEITDDDNATYFPKGELVIVSKNADYKKRDLHLCYKFDVYAHKPESRKWIYIDASTGAVIAELNKMCAVNVSATAVTRYSGTQTIMTDQTGPSSYRLRDATRGSGIETYDMNTGTDFSAAVDFTNTNTVWNTTVSYDNASYDAHWGAEAAYDYYLTIHGRNSIDNAGKKILGYVHYSVGYNDANWDGLRMRYGDGNNIPGGWKPWVSIQIVGHELTHGVIDYTCNLITQNESGALNESYADIMGTNLEFWKKPTSANWLVADEIEYTPGGALRSLSAPKTYNQPNTYKRQYWDSSGSDFGGVHKNNGVNNYWYYLVCMGGSGTNDLGNTYGVGALGITKGEQIVYRALTTYLTAYSEYADARIATIQAATDIYGACSPEVAEVTHAWYAVGIGPDYTPAVSVNFSASGTSACSAPFNVSFDNNTINASSATWSFGDGGTSSSWNASHSYAAPGTYTVKLVASGACGTDSLVSSSLITITTPSSPTGTGGTRCGPGTVDLSASGAGILKWYTAATGGTPIGVGSSFTTPSVAATTTYYAEDNIPGSTGYMGPVDQTFGANGPYGNVTPTYMIFDVYKACILRTVNVVATKTAIRNIDLTDASGTVLHTFTFNLDSGAHTISFDYPIQPGTGYHLGGDSLYFTFTGSSVVYPYVLPGVAAITQSSISIGTHQYFNFFYNWYIEADTCRSMRTAVIASVNPLPSAGSIAGSASVCEGSVTSLTDTAPGGVWSSSNTAVGTVSSAGQLSGITAGTTTVSYTVTNSCGAVSATTVATVNIAPVAGTIIGGGVVCQGASISVSDAAGGGAWSSGAPTVASVSSSGIVTALGVGTAVISYIVTNSCGTVYSTLVITVNPLPYAGAILGTATLCAGSTTALSDPAVGGIWSSGSPTVCSVDGTGVVTGLGSGTATISYTLTNSCGSNSATRVVTVNAVSAGTITGAGSLCSGSSISLGDAVSGGAWSSGAPGIATVGSTGLVTGVSVGTAIISYSITNSCGTASATAVVTVNLSASAGTITGTATVCAGSTTDLTDAVSGGSWISGNTLVATVGSTGIVTGVAAGTTTIYYTVTNLCGTASTYRIVTVNPAPNAGSITGTAIVCVGATVSLTDAAGGGAWSSAAPAIATIGSTGIVTGVSAGTAIISYSVTGSCGGTVAATRVVTVNSAPGSAGTITGTTTVCVGATTALTDLVAGGTWSSGATGVATVGSTGIVTGMSAGTATIYYNIINSCGYAIANTVVTVTGSSAGSITGPSTVVTGTSINLTDAVSGGTWAASNGNASVSAGGVVTGITAGTVIISYTVVSSCGAVTATKLVTVTNATSVSAISGYYFYLCAGSNATFWDATPGGSWSISPASVATVSPTGVVYGVSAGTATLSYTYGGTSVTATVTVYPTPAAITGLATVCVGATTALADVTVGGAWSSTATTIATISTAGVVTGMLTGTATINYTTTTAGCKASMVVTVTTAPSGIGGATSVCVGSSISLSDFTPGGIWVSTGNASVMATGSTTALVTGISAGSATITYALASTCYRTLNITVKAAPAPISGILTVCTMYATYLSDATTPGISWTSGTPSVATISASGALVGVSPGTTMVTYTAATGCTATATVTVYPTPAVTAILGASTVSHSGPGIILSDLTPGGVWSSSNTAILNVGSGTGLVTAMVSAGSANIYYIVTNGYGCRNYATKAISASPAPPSHGGTTTAAAGTTVDLANEQTAGEWISSDDAIATVDNTGRLYALSAGSVVITHTVINNNGELSISTTEVLVTALPIEASILPNPNKGVFIVKGNMGTKRDATVNIEITNMAGQVVYSSKAIAPGGIINEQIQLSNTLANGMYILNLHNGNENKPIHFVIE